MNLVPIENEVNMNVRKYIVVIASIMILLVGCKSIESKKTVAMDEGSLSTVNGVISNQMNNEVSNEDFSVLHEQNSITEKIDKQMLSDYLNVQLSDIENVINVKATAVIGDVEYTWYKLQTSKLDGTDILIEYIASENSTFCRLVWIEFLDGNIKTNRGVGIGDSIEFLASVYGDSSDVYANTDSTTGYEYSLLEDETEKSITFIVSNSEKLISEIYIDYGVNKVMEDFNIISFD